MGLISRVSSRTYRYSILFPVSPSVLLYSPSTMANSDNSQSPFDQYLVPLAVCVPVCVAAFFYMKNSLTPSELPPLETESAAKKPSKKKNKKKSTSEKAKAVVEEVAAEVEEEVEPVEEAEKVAPKAKKTGAQKRKEKKAKEEAEKKAEEKVVKKQEKKKGKAEEKVVKVVKTKVIEEEWNVVSDDKKVKGAEKKGSVPAAEEAKPTISEKQKKKAAKDRAEQQRKNAKKNDHLSNLPEEVLAQMAKFNAPNATITTAVFNDEWTDIAVKNDKPKKVIETVE